jgi:lipoic acid synthetase
VFGNNVETVRRLTPVVRDRKAGYEQTLGVLDQMHREFSGVVTKSSIMLGLGEEEAEVVETMRDLRTVGVEILTLGQYLRPSAWHLPVAAWITPERFAHYQRVGEAHGFRYVASGPLVRSSYRAAELFLRGDVASRRGGGQPGAGRAR